MGTSQMSAGNQRLIRKEMLVNALTTKENTMIFLRSKEKAFVFEKKYWAAVGEDSDEEEFINMALMATLEEQESSSASSQGKRRNMWYLGQWMF